MQFLITRYDKVVESTTTLCKRSQIIVVHVYVRRHDLCCPRPSRDSRESREGLGRHACTNSYKRTPCGVQQADALYQGSTQDALEPMETDSNAEGATDSESCDSDAAPVWHANRREKALTNLYPKRMVVILSLLDSRQTGHKKTTRGVITCPQCCY